MGGRQARDCPRAETLNHAARASPRMALDAEGRGGQGRGGGRGGQGSGTLLGSSGTLLRSPDRATSVAGFSSRNYWLKLTARAISRQDDEH